MLHFETALFILGMALFILGWLFFRNPGVSFWTFAPIWQAKKYLSPAGVALWVSGIFIAWAGVTLMFFPKLLGT